jgi:hypothetical protein
MEGGQAGRRGCLQFGIRSGRPWRLVDVHLRIWFVFLVEKAAYRFRAIRRSGCQFGVSGPPRRRMSFGMDDVVAGHDMHACAVP